MPRRTIRLCAMYSDEMESVCCLCNSSFSRSALSRIHPACVERKGMFQVLHIAKPVCGVCAMLYDNGNVLPLIRKLDEQVFFGKIGPVQLLSEVRKILGDWQVIDR